MQIAQISEITDWMLSLILAGVAFLYAAVGHGGASGYLFVMALLDFDPAMMKQSALILNIIVAGIAYFNFSKAAVFPRKIFLSLIVFSIPFSFLGGMLEISNTIFRILLGLVLIFTAIRMILPAWFQNTAERMPQFWQLMLAGSGIGFVSGLIGIGGGVLLSPLVLLAGWSDLKQSAQMSALFIVVNSISGLVGGMRHGWHIPSDWYGFIIPAIIGGIIGSWLSVHKFSSLQMSRILGLVIALASLKLILT
jgi:uncharacterized membrane protein YfcA